MSDAREHKNAVFQQTPPGVDPRQPTTTAHDKVKADFGIDIPLETVPLPSSGCVYPENSALHNVETVEIRAMTAREEDILTSKALLKKGTVITELIRSCLIDKDINPNELLTGDRNALMVAIRITGYGPEYDAELQCSECDTKAPRVFDLSALPIKRLAIKPIAPGMNLFEFTLPYTKKVVRFKFITGLDEVDIMSTSEKQKKLGLPSETNVTTNLLYSIVGVSGIEDRTKISNFVRMMPARDSLALRNYIRDNEPGITMRQEVTCPSCGHSEEVSMPIGVSFFWPSAGR
jgi:hypothetical protein